MGLLTGLVLLPLAPVRGVVWVAELVAEEAERELAAAEDPEQALAELDAARASGEISEEEAAAAEAALIDAVLARRQQLGGR
ncbi:MAG TPA: gas vesicle protein GvpG [Baekduia sp.]|nr:gas vesicle protein GvpG [Baekduia sp.]